MFRAFRESFFWGWGVERCLLKSIKLVGLNSVCLWSPSCDIKSSPGTLSVSDFPELVFPYSNICWLILFCLRSLFSDFMSTNSISPARGNVSWVLFIPYSFCPISWSLTCSMNIGEKQKYETVYVFRWLSALLLSLLLVTTMVTIRLIINPLAFECPCAWYWTELFKCFLSFDSRP